MVQYSNAPAPGTRRVRRVQEGLGSSVVSGTHRGVQQSERPKRSHRRPPTVTDRLATSPAIWVADIIVTLMVIVVLFWVYGSFWTNIDANRQQASVTREISGVWNRDSANQGGEVDAAVGDPWLAGMLPNAADGTPLMKMYIPRLGSDWEYTVVKGVSNDSLRKGPGLYTSTQLPGQKGNVGIAGHRDGNGAPFFHLDDMRTCDAVVLETRDNFYIYRVLPDPITTGTAGPETIGTDGMAVKNVAEKKQREQQALACMPPGTARVVAGLEGQVHGHDYAPVAGIHVTTPDDNAVIAPMPSDKSVVWQDAGISVLTITTCNPLYFNYERLIVHAALERIEPVRDGYVPAELEEVK